MPWFSKATEVIVHCIQFLPLSVEGSWKSAWTQGKKNSRQQGLDFCFVCLLLLLFLAAFLTRTIMKKA